MEYVQELLVNAAFLIIMVFAYTRIFYFFRQWMVLRQFLNGILFGLLVIAVMIYPVRIMPGVMFDSRSIVVSISGLFGGPVAATICALFAIVFRIVQGGAGATAGVVGILASGAIGVGYYYIRKKHPNAMKLPYIYIFSVIVHIAILLSILVLPFDTALKVLKSITLPLIIIYPFVSFIIISLLLDKESRIKDEKLLNNMFDKLTTGIVIYSPNSQVIFSNPRASELLGLSMEQTAINSAWSFINENGSKMIEEQYPVNQVLRTHKAITGYTFGVSRSKTDVTWILVNAFPEFDIECQLSQIIVTLTDITKNKQTQKILKAGEEKLKITLNSIGDGVISTDTDTLISSMNPEAERLTGWRFSEAKGKLLQDVFNIIDTKTNKKTHVKGLHDSVSKINMENHNTLISKNGSKYHISDSCSMIKNEKGDISGVVLAFRDITKDYQARELIGKRVNELECLRNLSEILEIQDITLEEICQKTLNILPPAFQHPDLACAKISVDGLEYKTDNYKQTQCVLSTDIETFGKLEVCYLEEKNEKAKDAFLYEEYELVNIIAERLAKATKRKHAAKRLLAAKEDAECANQVKSEFLANISHEIRSPLNGLLGFSEILENTLRQSEDCKCQDKLLGYLDIIKTCGQNLTVLISDILELSDIKGDDSDALLKNFSPEELIAESVEIFNFKAKEKNIVLTFEHENLPLEVSGAKKRLKQIIFNLVGNALKFTDKGSVTVKADYKDGNLLLEVKDTGIGIPADMKDKILEPFTQVQHLPDAKYNGTGLGLAIISRILEKLNGSLSIESELTKGTVMSFSFPVKVEEKHVAATSKKQMERKEKYNVIVIEDDEITGMYLDKILCDFNVNHKIAKSFALMKEICEDNFIPDIALIDISLPDADGFECMEWLKNQFSEKEIKCIAQTAHVLQEDIKRYEDAGFDGFICKPYQQEKLMEILHIV